MDWTIPNHIGLQAYQKIVTELGIEEFADSKFTVDGKTLWVHCKMRPSELGMSTIGMLLMKALEMKFIRTDGGDNVGDRYEFFPQTKYHAVFNGRILFNAPTLHIAGEHLAEQECSTFVAEAYRTRKSNQLALVWEAWWFKNSLGGGR